MENLGAWFYELPKASDKDRIPYTATIFRDGIAIGTLKLSDRDDDS